MSEKCMLSECSNEQRMDELEKNDNRITDALKSFESKLDTVITKLSRIEVLETSHGYQSEAVSRAHKRIDTLESAHDELRKFQHIAEGMAKVAWAVWGALGASVFMLFVKILFFMGANGVRP